MATKKGVLFILAPTVRAWFATGWRDRRRREQSLVQEGSRLQLRRLGVAGRKREAVTVEDSNPKGPEAIPDFQIEGDREPAGSSHLARSRSRAFKSSLDFPCSLTSTFYPSISTSRSFFFLNIVPFCISLILRESRYAVVRLERHVLLFLFASESYQYPMFDFVCISGINLKKIENYNNFNC